jgi:hypothetical protein
MGEQCLFEGCLCEIGRGVTWAGAGRAGHRQWKKERNSRHGQPTTNTRHPDNQEPKANILTVIPKKPTTDNPANTTVGQKTNPREEIASNQQVLKKRTPTGARTERQGKRGQCAGRSEDRKPKRARTCA